MVVNWIYNPPKYVELKVTRDPHRPDGPTSKHCLSSNAVGWNLRETSEQKSRNLNWNSSKQPLNLKWNYAATVYSNYTQFPPEALSSPISSNLRRAGLRPSPKLIDANYHLPNWVNDKACRHPLIMQFFFAMLLPQITQGACYYNRTTGLQYWQCCVKVEICNEL